MSMPEGYFTTIEGTYKAQKEATVQIAVLSLVSLILVFAVLYSRYGSAALSAIIMGNVPLALIGSVVAIWIVGGSPREGPDVRSRCRRSGPCAPSWPESALNTDEPMTGLVVGSLKFPAGCVRTLGFRRIRGDARPCPAHLAQ